jgi:hypothetical protein
MDGHIDAPFHCLHMWRVGVYFWEMGVWLCPSDDVRSSTMVTTVECIPLPHHIYRKCFSTLICHGWADGCALTLLRLCRVGVDFRKIGIGLSPNDVVMSWLRHQTTVESIPLPHQYIESVSAPRYAIDGHMGVPVHCWASAVQGVVGFSEYGLWPSLNDVGMLWLMLQTPMEWILDSYHICKKRCVL